MGVERPYRFDRSQMDALRLEMQAVKPELQDGYADLEVYVGGKFIDLYGKYLNDEQRDYMTHPFLLLAGKDTLPVLYDHFSSLDIIEDQDPSKAALNGKMYDSYHVVEAGATQQEGNGVSDHTHAVAAEQYWAGRFGAVPPRGDTRVTKDMLMSRATFDAKREDIGDIHEMIQNLRKRVEDTRQWAATNTWGSLAIHEKTHGIQAYEIALPLLEIDAYYREREVFRQNNWEVRPMPSFEKAVNYWGELLQDENFGTDLQLFMFGNLEEEERVEEIRELLRQKFTEEKMTELFLSPDAQEHVTWETREVVPDAGRMENGTRF